MKTYIFPILFLFLFYSCSGSKEPSPLQKIDYADIIHSLVIDSIVNLEADWRDSCVLMRLKTEKEPHGGIALLLKRQKNTLLLKRDNKWLPVEDIPDISDFDKKKLSYCYTLMTESPIRSISSIWRSGTIFIHFDSYSYFYTTDEYVVKTFKGIPLCENWWSIPKH